jgi:iron complex transport system ATP-binding protein
LDRLSHAEVAETVAYVAQDQAQWFPYTVAEIVLMGRYPRAAARRRLRPLAVWGWEDDEDRRIAAWAMEQTDVAHLAARSIQEVSGGERQRAMLACALAQEPRVLLLDEPTAFLDLSHQVDIARILRRQHEATGLTVILVSHDLNLAAQYCDRILLLDEGRAARIGTPAEVIRPDALAAVYRCTVLVDPHPGSGLPRVTLPGRERSS